MMDARMSCVRTGGSEKYSDSISQRQLDSKSRLEFLALSNYAIATGKKAFWRAPQAACSKQTAISLDAICPGRDQVLEGIAVVQQSRRMASTVGRRAKSSPRLGAYHR
jgi:hypothetical protein